MLPDTYILTYILSTILLKDSLYLKHISISPDKQKLIINMKNHLRIYFLKNNLLNERDFKDIYLENSSLYSKVYWINEKSFVVNGYIIILDKED